MTSLSGLREPIRSSLVAAISIAVLSAVFLALWTSRAHPQTDPRARVTVSMPAPFATPPLPNLIRPIAPESALKLNSERGFSGRADSAATPFRLRGDSASQARALNCLTQAIYYEASGEGISGERAVAQVVLNRTRHPGFPSTICGVVYQGSDQSSGCQFTFTCDGSLARVPAPALWKQAQEVAEEALHGLVFVAIGHATHYHADYVLPYWADSLDKSVQIGHHIFYRLKGPAGDPPAFAQSYSGSEPAPQPPEVIAAATEVASQSAAVVPPPSDTLAQDAALKPAITPNPDLLADINPPAPLADREGPATGQAPARPSRSVGSCPVNHAVKLHPLLPRDLRSAQSPDCSH